MRTTWTWLGEHVDLTGLDPEVVASRLTLAGLEVEGLHRVDPGYSDVVVARIHACEPHPDADRLRVCLVDIGEAEHLRVVCGAPNARPGLVAPLAKVGAVLPGDFVIKKGKIRGVSSEGMLCSASELGIEASSDGLHELDDALVPGTPLERALGVEDFVLELGLTPNRSDALGVIGLAREVAALFARDRVEPSWRAQGRQIRAAVLAGAPISDTIHVSVDDPQGCPRYAGAVLGGVRVAPTPAWMKARIEAIGLRSINGVVDATNYLMYERGQPFHAFDLRAIRGAAICVRRARSGESMESLDGVTRALAEGDLAICDAEGPIAVAGVMGGASSEIRDATTEIFLEAANFDPSTVRRTARRLGMHTDSSHRFERGVDFDALPDALDALIDLIVAVQIESGVPPAQLTVSTGSVDIVSPRAPSIIDLPASLPARVLGLPVESTTIVSLLASIDVPAALDAAGENIRATIPAFRPDLTRPIDLVEEVGRLLGYDLLPESLPSGSVGHLPVRRSDAPVVQERQPIAEEAWLRAWDRAREALALAGCHEAVNWAMVDPARLSLFDGDATPLRVTNPLGAETSAMRTTLLPGLLANVAHNVARRAPRVALFEIGHLFPPGLRGPAEVEPLALAAVFTGAASEGWTSGGRLVDVHDVVGVVESVAHALGVDLRVSASAAPPRWAHPGISADLALGGNQVGWVGALHPAVCDPWEIDRPVFAFELDFRALLDSVSGDYQYTEIPKTQGATRDVALLVADSVPYSEIRKNMEAFRHGLLESVELFDVYAGDRIPVGTRSVALRATYRRATGTLTDKEIETAHQRLVQFLTSKLDATQRA